ncbi:hypothetical protein CF319_g8265 [Tilletia indica]|nr:hypothetical protein CF319_g8265 [Tilletia indica]
MGELQPSYLYRRQCDECDKSFDKKSSFDHHFQTVHRQFIVGLEVDGMGVVPSIARTTSGEGPGVFNCPRPGCDWASPNPRYLQEHVKICTAVALSSSPPADQPADDIDRAFDELISSIDAAASEAARAYLPPPAPTMTAWLQHTSWPQLLEGQDLTAYAALAASSSEDGKELKASCAFVRAQVSTMHTALVQDAPRPMRQLLNCADETQAHVAKAAGVNNGSLSSYSAVFERAAAFWIKVKNAGPSTSGIELAQDILKNNSAFREAVERLDGAKHPALVVNFGIALLKEPVSGIGKSHPLIVFLAAYALSDASHGAFKTASIMGPVLSRLIYVLRLCFLLSSVIRFGDAVVISDPAFFPFFETDHQKQLGTGASLISPLKHLIGLRAYARKLAKAEGGRALFHWSEDGRTLLFQGVRLTLMAIRVFMNDSIERAQDYYELLTEQARGLGWANKTERLHELVDDASNTQPMYWFGEHPKNAAIMKSDYSRLMFRSLSKPTSDRSSSRTHLSVGSVRLDLDLLGAWRRLHRQFLATLLVAIHLTSGVPNRGTEILSSTYMNSDTGRARTVYIGPQGEVLLDCAYSKTERTATRAQQNVRFLHPDVGRLLVLYLIHVRPFAGILDKAQYERNTGLIFSDWSPVGAQIQAGRWHTTRLSRALDASARRSGLGLTFLGVMAWRQLAMAIAHKHLPRSAYARAAEIIDASEEDEDEEEEDDIWAQQANHSHNISHVMYGLSSGHRLGQDEDNIAKFRAASTMWQVFFRLIDERPPPTLDPLSITGGATEASLLRRAEHRQPVHKHGAALACVETQLTSRSSPAILARDTPPATLETIINFSGMSNTVQLRGEDMYTRPYARLPLDTGVVDRYLELFGDRADFAGLRDPIIADALNILTTTSNHLLVVAGTGSGKSSLWQTTSRLSDAGITVIVSFYVALAADTIGSCERMGIKSAVWEGPASSARAAVESRGVRVVVVTAKRAMAPDFLQRAQEQASSGLLRRIFIDEIHVLLDEEFRDTTGQMTRLTTIVGPTFVLMSATIPPHLESLLQQRTMLRYTTVRGDTIRKNLTYDLTEANDLAQAHSMLNELVAHVKEGQVLIICRQVSWAVQAAALLGCAVYHGTDVRQDGSLRETMDEDLKRFLLGTTSTLVGTSAASTGIHSSSIRLVVFVGDPYSVSSYAQGAGRAGRDGQPARTVVIRVGGSPHDAQDTLDPSRQALEQILQGHVCIRHTLGVHLDQRPGSCLERGAAPCIVCRKTFGDRLRGPFFQLHAGTLAAGGSDMSPSSLPGADPQPSFGSTARGRAKASTEETQSKDDARVSEVRSLSPA